MVEKAAGSFMKDADHVDHGEHRQVSVLLLKRHAS
jgi:hypothetical protein